jgi:metallo-beta-lactamase family protein
MLQEGRHEVIILGERVKVRARIETIQGYSGHKDSYHLVKFVEKSKSTLKKVFTVMGESSSAMFLAQKIHDNLGVTAIAPELNQTVELDF